MQTLRDLEIAVSDITDGLEALRDNAPPLVAETITFDALPQAAALLETLRPIESISAWVSD